MNNKKNKNITNINEIKFIENKNNKIHVRLKTVFLGKNITDKTVPINILFYYKSYGNECSIRVANFSAKEFYYEDLEKSITFEIWNTYGQEEYQSLNKICYKNAHVIVLVYDITRRYSFDYIKNYWYNEIINSCPKEIILVVLANNWDLYEYEEVSEKEGRNFAKSIGAFFLEIAKENRQKLVDLFYYIGKKYLIYGFELF